MEEVPPRSREHEVTIRRRPSDAESQRVPALQSEIQRLQQMLDTQRAALDLLRFQSAAEKQRVAEAPAQWVAAAQRVGRRPELPPVTSANEGAVPGRDLYNRERLQQHLLEVADQRAAERELRRRPPEFPIFTSGAPDPTRAGTPAEFVALMRDLQDWSGLSLRELEGRASRGELPKSTLGDALNRKSLPRLKLLTAFTSAAGLPTAERIGWDMAWHELKKRKRRPRIATTDPISAAHPETDAVGTIATEPLPQQRRRLFRRGQQDT